MSSEDAFTAGPLCLTENRPDGELLVQEEAVKLLTQLRQPAVVASVAGPYHTGESYLLNCLADKRKAQRTQAKAAQLQQKLLEEEQAWLKKMAEDLERSRKEQLRQLREKMEREKKKIQEETELMVQHKLEEQEKLLKEGFYQEAKEIEGEIQGSRKKKTSLS